MACPNEPGKHAGEALITPQAALAYFEDDPERVPESIVLCYHGGRLDYARSRSTWEIEGTSRSVRSSRVLVEG